MNICIDGLGANLLHGTGLYTYTFELMSNLFEMYPQSSYKIIWDDPATDIFNNRSNRIEYINLPLDRQKNDYSLLEHYMAQNKIHVYHSPNNGFSVPAGKVTNYCMTVHDLLAVSLPVYADTKYADKFKAVFPNALKNSDKIIVVSHFIGRELQEYYEVPNEKIEVIYPGCPEQFAPMSEKKYRPYIKEKYGIDYDYILFAGSIHRRKNLHMLFKVFKGIKNHEDNLKLVIAGKCDGKREEYYLKLKNLAEKMGVGDSVVFTGAVNYHDMPYLYNGAKCAVNLSLYEGFPSSSIEAMACGTPVVCARGTSFEETAGDAAVYADIEDLDNVENIILDIMYNRHLRETVIEKGRKQSRRYRWDNSIRKLISVYESIAFGN